MIFTRKKKTVEDRDNGFSNSTDEQPIAPTTVEDLEKKYSKYKDNFSPNNLNDKLSSIAKIIGKEATKKILTLYHLWKDTDSVLFKSVVAGVLGYLILPIDLIPDYIPAAGLSDDLAIIAIAISIIMASIKKSEWADYENQAEKDMICLFEPKTHE